MAFCLAAGREGRGAFCQIVSFGLAGCLVSVIRCLAGVLSGNDELAFCEKQFIAVKEKSFCFEVFKKLVCLNASSIRPVLVFERWTGSCYIFVQLSRTYRPLLHTEAWVFFDL